MSLSGFSCHPIVTRQRSPSPRSVNSSGSFTNWISTSSKQICSPHDIYVTNSPKKKPRTAHVTLDELKSLSSGSFEVESKSPDEDAKVKPSKKERGSVEVSASRRRTLVCYIPSKEVSKMHIGRARSPPPARPSGTYGMECRESEIRESGRISDPLRLTEENPSSSSSEGGSDIYFPTNILQWTPRNSGEFWKKSQLLNLDGGASPARKESVIAEDSLSPVPLSRAYSERLPKSRKSALKPEIHKANSMHQLPKDSLSLIIPASPKKSHHIRASSQELPSVTTRATMMEWFYSSYSKKKKRSRRRSSPKSQYSPRPTEDSFFKSQQELKSPESKTSDYRPERRPLKLCTLKDIVKRTTHPFFADDKTKKILFMCWRGFCRREELLEALKKQWERPDLPSNFLEFTPSEVEDGVKKAKRIIRVRVLNLLRYWLREFSDDFEECGGSEALRDLEAWTERITSINNNTSTKICVRHLLKEIRVIQSGIRPISRDSGIQNYPPHLWDIETAPGNILNVPCEEIARQMCLMDHEIFKYIRPHEFLGQSWKKKNKEIIAPNLTKMIHQFNEISCGTQALILRERNLDKRVVVLSRLFKICHFLECYRNLNSLCAVMAGIRQTPVSRLKKTFATLKPKHTRLLTRFNDLLKMDKNWKNLRIRMSNLTEPGIPYIGLFLKDVLFIDDGNVSFRNGMINFPKYNQLNERIGWCLQFQNSPFRFRKLDKVQEELRLVFKIIPQDFLYELSRTLEPQIDRRSES